MEARWLKTLKVRAFVPPSFTGGYIGAASRYEVEKLLENNNLGKRWFLVYAPTEW